MRGDKANEGTLGQDNKAKPNQKKEILVEVLDIQEQVAQERG